MKKIITTVGASLFTNYMDIDVKSTFGEKNYKDIRDDINNLKNQGVSNYDNFKYEIKELKETIENLWLKGIMKSQGNWVLTEKSFINFHASAEISSINKLLKEINENEIEIYFLTSDTVLSKLAAEILKHFFEEYNLYQGINISAKIDTVTGINVLDRNKFLKIGLNNLIEKLNKISGEYFSNVILNITGGFKGLIPYLTIWAQIHYVPTVYIFEESEQLIKLPQTPITMDYGVFEKYSDVIEKLAAGDIEQSKKEFIEKNKLYDFPTDIIGEVKDGNFSLLYLEPLGLILWNKYKSFKRIYLPKQSKYFDYADKKTLNIIFSEMYEKINSFSLEDFRILKDNKIKHAQLEDTWVYKTHCCSAQYRIQYKYEENKKLIIYNFVRIQSERDDKTYVQQMKQKYDNLKNRELIPISI